MTIIGGYEKETENFIKSNPGLASRFNIRIKLLDYSVKEMLKILYNLAEKKGYKLTKGAEDEAIRNFEAIRTKRDFGNARYVENYFNEAVINLQSELIRLKNSGGNRPTREMECTLDTQHFLQEERQTVVSRRSDMSISMGM